MKSILFFLIAILFASPLIAAEQEKTPLLLPADIKEAIAKADTNTRASLCTPQGTSMVRLQIVPVKRVSGLTSRQDNVSSVDGAWQLEDFAQAFSSYSVLALATDDAGLKERLINTLAKWAEAGALLQSPSCVKNGVLNTSGQCAEWRDPEGRDLSAMKDATFTTFIGAGLIRSYYIALADFEKDRLRQQHASINKWIGQWSRRLKQPNSVYFGLNMGWYWPNITNDLAEGNSTRAASRLKTVEAGLIKLINDDGSIVDRTTRGDRALWYHYTSIGEIVVSMELMRANGMTPSPKLEQKLHAAVSLFVRALADNSILDKWAKVRRNSRYSGTQDWSANWPDNNFAGTWMHIYQYRYPNNPSATVLRGKVRPNARSAVADIDLGIGLGCLYNIAATIRKP